MTDTSQNLITEEEAENVSYLFPTSEKIIIQKSDLQIQLDKFKKRIKASFSVFDLLAIISIWSPIYSADFKELFFITSKELKVGYIVFATLITIFILGSRIKDLLFSWKRDNVSPDSEKMAQKVLEQCQSKPRE